MATKSDSLIPVLLLAGLAAFLLYQRNLVGGVTSTAATKAKAQASTDKINAVGNAIKGVFTSIVGGITSNDGNWSNAKPSEAALDQVIEAAKAWDKAYGGVTGTTGDPYNSD